MRSEKPRIVVLGASGLLGQEISHTLSRRALPYESIPRSEIDTESEIEDLVKRLEQSDVCINCIAFTDVDLAERQQSQAFQVNSKFPGTLAEASNIIGARLVHFSTDFVFSGDSGRPYSIHDQPNPINVYGASKLEGEERIREVSRDYVLIRTSSLYSRFGQCFPTRIARALAMSSEVKVVDDQFSSPTWGSDLANAAIDYALMPVAPRLVHAVSTGSCSKYELAIETAKALGLPTNRIHPIESTESGSHASRPRFPILINNEGPLNPIGHWKSRWLEAKASVLA